MQPQENVSHSAFCSISVGLFLDCRFVVPMQNGDLDAKGILASIIKKEGTIELFKVQAS